MHTLNPSRPHCPVCRSPVSGWQEEGCPNCLMRLGALAISLPTEIVKPLRRLGDYELLEEIARGGMGVVYRARQLSLNREVAVKVVLGGVFADDRFRQRFQREAEAAASLNHPNIVAIHEIGEHEAQPYFAMELITGRSLAELSRNNPLPAEQAARLVQAVAQGVHFAHERGVLHRDLKPSNILVDAEGIPHITDFGLAKRVADDAELTLTGQILGSPSYMSPEQADPKRGPTTAASDIYSLGAILYHLLTGRAPFMAETVARTLRLVAEGEAVSPRLLNPGVSRDLETICLKCLETEPGRRYASAREVAEELGAFLRNEPIRARPLSPLVRLSRWCARNPALARSLALVAVLLVVVTFGSLLALVRIQGEQQASELSRQEEAAARVRAETAEARARQQLYHALLEQAHASVRSGEIGQRVQALDAIQRAAAISNSVALRREALTALALPDLKWERTLPGGSEFTLQRLDPAFERLAVCRNSGPVEIRAVTDGRLLASLPGSTNRSVYVAKWSADGRYLAIKRDHRPGGATADLEVWSVAEGKRVLLERDLVISAFAFQPHENRLLYEQTGGRVTLWDLAAGQPVNRWASDQPQETLEFSPDGKTFASLSGGEGLVVTVQDAVTGGVKVTRNFPNHALNFGWHPQGRWLAVTDRSGVVHLMNPQTGETRALGSHKVQAVSAEFSPDGDYLFTGGWEGELICWDLRTLRQAFVIGRASWTMQFCTDGRQCAIITEFGVQLHTFDRPLFRTFAEDLGPRLRHASFSPDGRWLAASADRALGVWDLTRNAPAAVTDAMPEAHAVFTADGKEFFASNQGGAFAGWQIASTTNAMSPPQLKALDWDQTEGVTSFALLSDKLIVTGERGSRITGLECLTNSTAPFADTVQGWNGISPDGKWLGIFGSFSPFLYVYRLPELTPVATLDKQTFISNFHFTPDGREVALTSRTGVEFWSTETWQRTRRLTNCMDILFPPDRSTWWLTRDFRTAGLYDAATSEVLLPLSTGRLPLALSADGRQLAVSVDARQLQLWDLNAVREELRHLGLDWGHEPAPALSQTRQ